MHEFTNQLIHESSPYLLQHAHNPVNWFPWSQEILDRAKSENKPVLVSIGYAACHWCHVMERESFENEETARFMNEHFINIKIDREERPDIDHIYMDAVQAMTGSGGWPLNVFLTPEAKPFYGGTYFPPVKAFNRPSWMDVLAGVATAFRDRREEVESQAEGLTGHLMQSSLIGSAPAEEVFFSQDDLHQVLTNLMANADKTWGGFGAAPKFPQTFSIQYLLRYAAEFSGSAGARDAVSQALLSLDKMIDGGIYDQLGGGFARYSTDEQWLAPHFEKMLYDNALLVSVLSEAYQFTGMQKYRVAISETMDFVQRELTDPESGFYSALDADSEGEEGRFYVWDRAEVDQVLGAESALFCEYYDISKEGNWAEHPGKPRTNILRVLQPLEVFAAERDLNPEELRRSLARSRLVLLRRRSARVRPRLDDKIILGWNALMNKACSKAFAATGEEAYRELALRNMEFLLGNFGTGEKTQLHHTWKNGQGRYPAFLDDYAYLVEALIQLQEITRNSDWLKKAAELVQFVQEEFSDESGGLFYYTGQRQSDVLLRKKEIYDGATPSGNAVMTQVLRHMGILMDKREWLERSFRMPALISPLITKYPGSFGVWNSLLLEMQTGTSEIAVVGRDSEKLYGKILSRYLPNRVLMGSDSDEPDFPLLHGKEGARGGLIYLCKDFVCLQPVITIEALIELINSAKKAS